MNLIRVGASVGLIAVVLMGCSTDESNETSRQIDVPDPIETMAKPDGPIADPDSPLPSDQDPIDLTAEGSFVTGFAEPTIIDTRSFAKPIRFTEPFQGEIRSTSALRPPTNGLPAMESGRPNDLIAGGLNGNRRIAPLSSFPGISQTQWTPPDPTVAVGPNHIVQTVNMTVSFFSKSGEIQFQQLLNDTAQPGFFDEVGAGNFVFDPKCFYDHYANRFFIVACEVYDDILESYITIAVSDDDDPNGIWYKYRTFAVVEIDSSLYWVDYPGVGFDAQGMYVTANLFLLAGDGSGFGNSLFRSFLKEPILNGDTAQFTSIRNPNAASVQVAQCFGDNQAPFFVSRNTSTRLRVIALDNPFDSPSFDTFFVDVPEYGSPPDVPNGTSGNFLQPVGNRIMNVHWRDGGLWTCHAIADSTGSRAIARWYEIETGSWPASGEPTLVQSGNIDLGDGYSTFFPAVYTDANGNAAVVVARSRGGEFASVAVAGRLASDPPGSMSQIEVLDIGSTSADGRWGDYFDIALDPTDNATFWMTGQVAEPFGWQTTVESFTLVLPGDVNEDGVVNLLDVDPFVELLVSGQFNAAADLNSDGVVDLLDVEPFVDLLSG